VLTVLLDDNDSSHTRATQQPHTTLTHSVCHSCVNTHLQRSLAKLIQAWKCCSLLAGQNLLLLSLTCVRMQVATQQSSSQKDRQGLSAVLGKVSWGVLGAASSRMSSSGMSDNSTTTCCSHIRTTPLCASGTSLCCAALWLAGSRLPALQSQSPWAHSNALQVCRCCYLSQLPTVAAAFASRKLCVPAATVKTLKTVCGWPTHRCCLWHMAQWPGSQLVAEGVGLIHCVRLADDAHHVWQLRNTCLSDLQQQQQQHAHQACGRYCLLLGWGVGQQPRTSVELNNATPRCTVAGCQHRTSRYKRSGMSCLTLNTALRPWSTASVT
jgi:hypothetical protein